MGSSISSEPVCDPTEEMKTERQRLREKARTAERADERREAIRHLAELERKRNRETYEKLARE